LAGYNTTFFFFFFFFVGGPELPFPYALLDPLLLLPTLFLLC
jgi:hypothetical protein